MADKTVEQLSALVDGEIDVLELELALRRLTKDSELKARWQRYHLISDAIRNNLPESIDMQFADRVSQAIESEPVVEIPAFPAIASWYKPLAGFAVAASVATVVLLGLYPSESEQPAEAGSLAVVASAERTMNVQTNAISAGTIAAEPAAGAELESRLNSYLVNHNEFSSMNQVQGMLPYVRMVGHKTEP